MGTSPIHKVDFTKQGCRIIVKQKLVVFPPNIGAVGYDGYSGQATTEYQMERHGSPGM
jgi:hypothetical protein